MGILGFHLFHALQSHDGSQLCMLAMKLSFKKNSPTPVFSSLHHEANHGPAHGVPIPNRNTRSSSSSILLSISSKNVQFLKLTSEKTFPLWAESIISLFPSPVSGEFMPLLFLLMMRVFAIQHYQCAATSAFLQCVCESKWVSRKISQHLICHNNIPSLEKLLSEAWEVNRQGVLFRKTR